MSKRLSAAQWADYWQAGTVTTFMGRFANNYDGVILKFWEAVFDRLPDDARIVDLATGNGALAILAAQYAEARNRDFSVTGVDFAPTHPKETLKARYSSSIIDAITFVTDTRLEQTGLPGHEFDLVCSQFGLEYGDLPQAVAEVDRLLSPDGGVFAAMMHVDDSAIVAQAHEAIRQIRQCAKSGLIDEVSRLLPLLENARENGVDPATDPDCEALRASINRITGKLHNAQNQYKDPGQIAHFLSSVMSIFDSSKGGNADLATKLAGLDDLVAEHEQYLMRMRDLVSSALRADDITELVRALEACGLKVEASAPVNYEGHHFCHAMVACR